MRRLVAALDRIAPTKESAEHAPDQCIDEGVADILRHASSQETHKLMSMSWEGWY